MLCGCAIVRKGGIWKTALRWSPVSWFEKELMKELGCGDFFFDG